MIKKFSKLLLGLLVFNTLCSPIFAIVHANERSVPSEEIILNTWQTNLNISSRNYTQKLHQDTF